MSSTQPRALTGAATLAQRLRAMRTRRMASQRSQATTLAAWIVSVAAILALAGGGLLNVH